MKLNHSKAAAFSLVEITLALGVMSFCLLAIFGLLPVGLTSNQVSIDQTVVSNIAMNIVADLRATPLTGSNPVSPIYKLPIPVPGNTASPLTSHTLYITADGTKIGTILDAATNPTQNPRYRVTVQYIIPSGTASSGNLQGKATPVHIWITWPALADMNPTKNGGLPSNFVGSFETVVGLDR